MVLYNKPVAQESKVSRAKEQWKKNFIADISEYLVLAYLYLLVTCFCAVLDTRANLVMNSWSSKLEMEN